MTRDEALAKAVEAAALYEVNSTARRLGPWPPGPPPPSDWKAPNMGHIVAALNALGLIRFDDDLPQPQLRAESPVVALQWAMDGMYPQSAPRVAEQLERYGFKIVRIRPDGQE